MDDELKPMPTDDEIRAWLEEAKTMEMDLRSDPSDPDSWERVLAYDGTSVLVGEGFDIVESWYEGFEAVRTLEHLVEEASLEDVLRDVRRELRGNPELWRDALPRLLQDLGHLADGDDLQFVEHIPGVRVDQDVFDGGAPGGNGSWIRVWAEESRYVAIVRSLWQVCHLAQRASVPPREREDDPEPEEE